MKVRCGVGSFLAAIICATGCLRQQPQRLTWVDFLPALTNIELLARLDVPPAHILTSYDPSGGNEDYNHFVRKGPKGWVVLADLKGPGVVTRFWMTGADDGQHRVRFYFDGEKKPRLDVALGDLCGGRFPFVPPLAAYENYCWYNFFPFPYRKRLVVMTQEGGYREGGWPRIFYQINYIPLPKTTQVASFTLELNEEDRRRIEEIRAVWTNLGPGSASPSPRVSVGMLELKPQKASWLQPLVGPGIIRSLRIRPLLELVPSATAKDALLRNVILQIRWDGEPYPSVEVPLGNFFGSFGAATRYSCALFGMTNDTFWACFPMPFEKQADIILLNNGRDEVRVEAEAKWEPLKAWDPAMGYFHATWSRSTSEDVGRPHPILRVQGAGRYVGCVLAVMSEEPSWWVLEGDEKMYVDGSEDPYWHGTGLEDYFNGGWYYQNPLARPLHGIVYKVFFDTVQYRLHLVDPVLFQKSFDMHFERGPDHASRASMESVAYYYLSAPRPVPFAVVSSSKQALPSVPWRDKVIMTQVLNFERLGDYRGAQERIERFLEDFPDSPFEPVLRLRQLLYAEYLEGPEVVWGLCEKFLLAATDERAIEQAKLVSWFHERKNRALVSLYASGRANLVLDGRVVATVSGPDRAQVVGVELQPGRHCLAIQFGWQPYPNWVQASVKTHDGFFGTAPDWKFAFNPTGNWGNPGYNDRGWQEVGGTGVKGPPEEPYIWLEPNAFIGLQSQSVGLRVDDKYWPRRDLRAVLRKEFEIR